MKTTHLAILCMEGKIIKGYLYISKDKLLYYTNKKEIPDSIRNIEMLKEDIKSVTVKPLLLPVVIVELKNDTNWKFYIYSGSDVIDCLAENGYEF